MRARALFKAGDAKLRDGQPAFIHSTDGIDNKLVGQFMTHEGMWQAMQWDKNGLTDTDSGRLLPTDVLPNVPPFKREFMFKLDGDVDRAVLSVSDWTLLCRTLESLRDKTVKISVEEIQ